MATLKQKAVFDKVVNSIEKPTMGSAMIEAGYSENTSKQPAILTTSIGWKELMDIHLSEEKLSKAHEELLNQKKTEYFVFPKKMEDEEIMQKVTAAGFEVLVIQPGEKGKYAFYSIADAQAKKAALEMGYKLRGSYAPDKSINLNLTSELDNEQLNEIANKLDALRRTHNSGNGESSDGVNTSPLDREV